ncbi:hypothetical protein CBR_g36465 [Chara braunii]|uniref:HAT C-terminal dimerisation domain-containing protein n=1 Tax=Chara braunii TaxID=69332 RepID=A0A388LKT9_CHABU|nr:hypothetical protein CBR_g36465 [Chara braunii]|eukprot:GBG82938.1 hypothetical protein CBR_g36465 [Chara braunii]
MVRTDLRSNFEEVTATILDDNFWDDVEKSINTTEAIVKLLKMVDSPGATISKVYHHMDDVVDEIRKLEVLMDFEKAEGESILMDRWAFMTSELHCAGTFLDPEFRAHSAIHDTEIREGFNIWLYTWAAPDDLNDISWQVDDWVRMKGALGSREALDGARLRTPSMWWDSFGSRLNLLQPQAIKLLGQTSSSAACERNWSLHELIFGRRRTKLLSGRLAKLVYNNWNLHLQWRQEKGAGQDDVHIPWMEDLPNAENKAEAERFYNEWVQKVKESTGDMGANAEDHSVVIAE